MPKHDDDAVKSLYDEIKELRGQCLQLQSDAIDASRRIALLEEESSRAVTALSVIETCSPDRDERTVHIYPNVGSFVLGIRSFTPAGEVMVTSVRAADGGPNYLLGPVDAACFRIGESEREAEDRSPEKRTVTVPRGGYYRFDFPSISALNPMLITFRAQYVPVDRNGAPVLRWVIFGVPKLLHEFNPS